MKLKPPASGVTIRMYRQGHGDCFLIAFPPAKKTDEPVYVLIDCGRKKGSQDFLPHKKNIDVIAKHIGEATGKRLDLVVLTHEHDDHLNGILGNFEEFDIQESWFAWTEDPDDALANDLRKKAGDQLLRLAQARKALALAVTDSHESVQRIDNFLGLETGEESSSAAAAILAARGSPANSGNKKSMKLVKTKSAANRGVRFLKPNDKPLVVPGSAGIKAYVLGPPRNATLLGDEDPHGDEAFPRKSTGISFGAAVGGPAQVKAPFAAQYCIGRGPGTAPSAFLDAHYGDKDDRDSDGDEIEVSENPAWRRIDDEWLFSAEALALKLNKGINNTSLVLAFELPKTKKVLLFAADAQRGNWISWSDCAWGTGAERVDAKDLLARTVLYKVGHHGSHNATLRGDLSDTYANLSWMAQGAHASEFTAMITAVNEWAVTKNTPPWNHPLPSIRKALLEKAQGRVFQTDIASPTKPTGVSDASWMSFQKRITCGDLYFDLQVFDR